MIFPITTTQLQQPTISHTITWHARRTCFFFCAEVGSSRSRTVVADDFIFVDIVDKAGRRSCVLLLIVRLRPLAPAWSSRRKLERASQHRTDHDCKNGRVCACGGLRKKLRIYKNTCMTLYVCVKDASCDIESIKWTHISHQLQNRRTCATCDNMHRDRWSRLQER